MDKPTDFLETLIASALPVPLLKTAYCFSCDGIHALPVYVRDPDNPGMYMSEADGTPSEGETCEGDHIPSCTCRTCEYLRLEDREIERKWKSHFHSKNDAENAPPISFLISGFLQREGVTAIAAPVRERKSLIALNIAHALLTGEKLFGHFEVVKRPARVLYLCPEVSLGPFTDRVKKIGLLDYVGETFFYRTLSSNGHLKLPDLNYELPGSVVFLDTAIRFLDGDENSSADVRAFADQVFSLLRKGAEAVVLLHHSPKDSGDIMTLENAMRGSGDMGAFLACCWGTKLQDPSRPYESRSFLSNLKQRDFEAQDFEVTCRADCRMQYVEGVNVALASRKGFKGNKDGMDEKATAFIRENPKMSVRDIAIGLQGQGIKRGKTWVRDKKYELMQGGVRTE